LDQFISLDLHAEKSEWKQLSKIPQPLSHTVLTTTFINESGQIYLTGGRKKNSNGISDLFATTYVYDIVSNTWQAKADLPYPLCAGTGIALNSNYILMFGGDKGTTFHQVEILIAAINSEKEGTRKLELILQKNKLQSEHPGFSKEILMYNIKTNSWKIVDNIPFDTPVTTTAFRSGNEVYLPSGEIRAGVRSPKILSVKILQK
jgi:N-acetylneuraminic acid mutarotase